MWLGDFKGTPRVWNQRETLSISSFLTKCNERRPTDIHRSIRSLNVIKYWKATEFRTFILYIGIVVLKGRLEDKEYKMFLKLFGAVTICSSKMYTPYLSLARKLFLDFIEDHINIYGDGSITINIHNTSHVVDDVERFGPLDTISAYAFENHLYSLKTKLKQCNHPLKQIARRIIESTGYINKVHNSIENVSPIFKKPFNMNDDILCHRYIEYRPKVFLSSDKNRDKWFLTFSNDIVEFDYCVRSEGGVNVIKGTPFKNVGNFFDKIPFDSSYLNIFSTDYEKGEQTNYKISQIKAKMFCIQHGSRLVFVPLLHTL